MLAPRALERLRVLSRALRSPNPCSHLSSTQPISLRAFACASDELRKVDDRRGHQVPKDLRSSKGSALEYLETGARKPSHAEKTMTLCAGQRQATLSTVSRDAHCGGFPFGSLTNYAIGPDGEIITYISALAEHRMNVENDARCSMLVVEAQGSTGAGADPLSYARATIVGELILAEKTPGRRAAFIKLHPRAFYVDFDDFGCFVMEPQAVRYVGGFGEMSWVEAEAFKAAQPDYVSAGSANALEHMNEDHKDATVAILRHRVKGLETATDATILAIDRYGFEALAELPVGPRRVRVAFDKALAEPDEIKAAIIGLLRQARASGVQGGGELPP